MHSFCKYISGLALAALLCSVARAETLHLTDGKTVTGEVVTMDDRGVIMKQSDGNYSDPIPWNKLTQDDLKTYAQNPKLAQFVEPWIEVSQAERAKAKEIQVTDVPHFSRPPKGSLIGAMTSSGIGLFMLFMIYAGNIYAAYEIALVRARPIGLVCGVSAVLPLIGPILFLCLPPSVAVPDGKKVEEWKTAEEYAEAPAAAALEAAEAQATAAAAQAAADAHAAAVATAPALPPIKSYPRGQFTFNRRFFETQMPGFFGVVRSGGDKDMVLSIRSARGTHVGQRIQRIAANELYLQVEKENASEEVVIPFIEIQEVQIKHKDA